MALFNGFTFDGVNSLDYGIYITGEGVYNAPERAVEMVEIQGRNGALAIDQGRWDNIEVTYHCGCFGADQADFAERIGRFRNAICSRTSYCRLTDDYHPDEYRLALYHAGVEVDHVRRAGEFDLIFDCKPQRFLTSGEDTITVGDWGDATEYSGDIVSFEGDEMTAVKSLSVSLSPIQNLNGYDHPWVGGAGKNKFGGTYQTQFTLVTPIPSGTVVTASAKAPSSGTVRVDDFDANGNRIDYWSLYTTKDGRVYNTFTTTAETYRIGFYGQEASEYMIELGSTATAYEPYSNICPISGWDGMRVPVTGVNVWDEVWELGGLNTDGTNASASNRIRTKNYIPVKPNTTYYAAFPNTITLNVVCFYDLNKNYVGGTYFENAHRVRTTPSNAYYMRFQVNASYGTTYNHDISINYPATDTSYHAYNGDTYSQEFEDSQGNTLTVYGGESEIVGGVLTVTHKLVDMRDLTFSKNTALSGFDRFAVNLSDMKPTANATALLSAISSAYEGKTITDANNSPRAGLMAGLSTFVYFYELANAFTDAEFKTARSGQTLCYELATPQTYTLTPQQVETLIGTNNIWSDAGEVTVEIADDPNKIVNPTLYDARPLIKVSGYGTVQVGSVTITIEGSASDVTYIDCDSMECYRLNGLAIVSANSAVSFSSYDFPVLEADAITGITYSTNISQVQIVPRWWQL